MSDLTPELRAEIAQHTRESSGIRGGGMIFRDMERGLTVEQIAASQPTSLDNARSYVRAEAMLRGELPTAPSMALKASGGYRLLLGCNLSPALRGYVKSCLRQLAAINPEIRVEELFVLGRPREPGTRARSDDAAKKTAWPTCHMIHAGDCF